MQQIVREHQTYPPKIVASVTSWELWKTLKGKDLTDQCDWVELRVDALPPGTHDGAGHGVQAGDAPAGHCTLP